MDKFLIEGCVMPEVAEKFRKFKLTERKNNKIEKVFLTAENG